MTGVVISGTGLYTPPHSISNEELVVAFNLYVDKFNQESADEIKDGTVNALEHSDAAFIEKASGIKSRYVVEKEGVIDPNRMKPRISKRPNDDLCLLAEMAVSAAKDALEAAGKKPEDVGGVLLACSSSQRAYPAVAVEVQAALGTNGFGFDMNVACSSATFAIQVAVGMISSGNADAILVVNPEICSAHLNFCDRDSHFIFGDVATAILLERADISEAPQKYEIVGTKLKTSFSNNIRSNAGFLNRVEIETTEEWEKLFVQEGRKVFREVTPMVAALILEHMAEFDVQPDDIKRLWLHQANIHMNDMIGKKVLGRVPANDEAPIILDEYANTSSAGSIIAFHKYSDNLAEGDLGIICSFGAGYSIGSVILRKL